LNIDGVIAEHRFVSVDSRFDLAYGLPMKILRMLVVIGVAGATSWAEDQRAGVWDLERLKQDIPTYRVVDDAASPIQSLIYNGEAIDGQGTEVFAFYASPKTLGNAKPDETFPGIVLIHGGGGTAFAEWVWLWANRGYAAIAMDLSGSRPVAPKFDAAGQFVPGRAPRTKLAKGGLDHTHKEKFDCIGGRIDDDWPYHAVASVMRAHTLLRSFLEVDADKTAVTGISWGGYSTCLVASLDDRFKAAVPVYGCGFLHEGESVQKPSIDRLGDRRAAWIAAYDPSSHLAKCTIPTFWVNGTHDVHYVLDSYAKSYALVKGPKTFRIQPRMPHGHAPGWKPEEIGLFVDSVLLGGTPLPEIGSPIVSSDGTVSVSVKSVTKITSVAVHYTSQLGKRSDRKWAKIDAVLGNGKVSAEGLPGDANTWLMTITDERGALVTSEVQFR
jgi:dienelactone hydrolase